MSFFDPTVPCGTYYRGCDRYSRAQVERFAKKTGVPYQGRTMDAICTDLGTTSSYTDLFSGFVKIPITTSVRSRYRAKPSIVGGRPCSTYGRECDRLTRYNVDGLADKFSVPAEGRTMDQICADLAALGL